MMIQMIVMGIAALTIVGGLVACFFFTTQDA